MNRRGFFKRIGLVVGSLIIGIPIPKPQRKLKVIWSLALNRDYYYLGYKDSQFLETGIVYAPYIPMYRTFDIRWA